MARHRVYRAYRPSRSGYDEYRFANRQAGGYGSDDPRPMVGRFSSLSDQEGLEISKAGEFVSHQGDEHQSSIAHFLALLSPGIEVVVQYDDQPPAFGVFQGLKDETALLTHYNGYPGLVRLDLRRINAVSVF